LAKTFFFSILIYRISDKEFLELRRQFIELFPTENSQYIYKSWYMNNNKQGVSASGCLYDTYKYWRNQLRITGYFSPRNTNASACKLRHYFIIKN